MKNNPTFFSTLVLLLCTTLVFAQENVKSDHSIDQQFNDLLENSNNYKQYKVVKRTALIELQNNTKAEIADLEKEIAASKKNIEAQKKEIAQINASLDKTTKNLEGATKAKDEIAFFGIPTNKATFRIIMWGMVLILIVALVLFISKFKNSHIVTKRAKKDLQETQEEFDEYRKSALEKQQKLGRMLQDERNKSVRHADGTA